VSQEICAGQGILSKVVFALPLGIGLSLNPVATLDDLSEICDALPGAVAGDQASYGVMVKGKVKGFVWAWMERVHPQKAKVMNLDVLAIRTPGLAAKDALLASGHPALFTEPHYNGYPAILVRIAEIDRAELEPLLIGAWESVRPS